MSYSVRVAFQSLWHEKWINFLSMVTIAMGLLMIALVSSSIYNVELFARKLPEKFFVVAYLNDQVSEQDAREMIASLKEQKIIEKITYISKDDALKELRASLKDADYILEGLNENPLPASIEIRFKKEAVGPNTIKQFVDSLRKMRGIDDVQYGEKFLLSIHSIKAGIETVGLVLTGVMVSGIIFICYSTVKLLFYRRREEVETLKLLGATRGFIRAPFVIEGGIIGAVGGLLSAVIVFGFYYGLFLKLSAAIPLIRSVIFPTQFFLLLPVVGLGLGITGSVIAMGRIRFS